ncbi:ArpA protein [Actinomadura sp. KC06]|nr:ArpA protein [Actinomadura sp. KC06]
MCEKLDRSDIQRLSHRFHRYGIVTVTELIKENVRDLLRKEAERLLDLHAERRDLRLATTDNTRRSMSVVPSETIANDSELVRRLYAHSELTSPLEAIAGEKLHPCPKPDEEFLITRQEQSGDTHGWHWGDFSFALIWVLVSPPINVGGLLQCVPHTSWDKSNPQINRYLVDNPIDTYFFTSGDVYFLRTDTTLHRTIPLEESTTRIILNMTWAGTRDLNREFDADDRWWDDAGVSAATSVER